MRTSRSRTLGAALRSSLLALPISLPISTTLTGAALCLALLGTTSLSGCAYSNAHGYQDLPHVIRIESIPADAQMTLVDENLVFTLPADIEMHLSSNALIHVEKDGYRSFYGRLSELQRSALNTYCVKLRPIDHAK